MTRRIIMLLIGLYLVAPVMAGIYGIGDRRGPRIYAPEVLHEILYRVGWSLAGHEGKPRVRAIGGPPRPWFWGL